MNKILLSIKNPRKPCNMSKIIVANWKMNGSLEMIDEYSSYIKGVQKMKNIVIIAPPFVYLKTLHDVLHGSGIFVASQDVSSNEKTAFTGKICTDMIADCGAKYAIIGHSEQRQYRHLTDEEIKKKAELLLHKNLKPIICIGETWKEKEEGFDLQSIQKQLYRILNNIDRSRSSEIIIAYEPV